MGKYSLLIILFSKLHQEYFFIQDGIKFAYDHLGEPFELDKTVEIRKDCLMNFVTVSDICGAGNFTINLDSISYIENTYRSGNVFIFFKNGNKIEISRYNFEERLWPILKNQIQSTQKANGL